jgi:hypothetical protein
MFQMTVNRAFMLLNYGSVRDRTGLRRKQ